MPDIALCEGTGCPLKEKCYRYKATPSKYRQSYFYEIPYLGSNCEYFVEIRGKCAENGEKLTKNEDENA